MSTANKPLSISQLNRQCKSELETRLGTVWVQGEISNFSRPGSGHWYFSLKDEQAQLRAAMFKGKNSFIQFAPKNGLEIIARGKVTVFEPRGDLQIIIDFMEVAGQGRLQREFEALKQKLAAEGLFEQARKLPVPEPVTCIGLITSPTGAAVQDIIQVLRRRYPLMRVIIYPCLVQGQEASNSIIDALNKAIKRQECDVLMLTRGGGSIEDLWAFNNEQLARSIAACDIPVVSAVGHEIDFTICDFVADLRAPTPSAGAELLSPDIIAMKQRLSDNIRELFYNIEQTMVNKNQLLDYLIAKLNDPTVLLADYKDTLENLLQRLQLRLADKNHHSITALMSLQRRLQSQTPKQRIAHHQSTLQHLQHILQQKQSQIIAEHRHSLALISEKLHAISPLKTLARGYSVTFSDGELITDTKQISVGDTLHTQLHQGSVSSEVKSILKEESKADK